MRYIFPLIGKVNAFCLPLLLTFVLSFPPFLLSSHSSPLSTPALSPKYEVRAAWLATIGGIDWPCSTNAATQKEEMRQMLDQLRRAGINTVLFQARVRATTVYPSAIEPWDICVNGGQRRGTTGTSPGYDPLQLCIEMCHERGMECHAWVVTLPVGKWNSTGCKLLRQKFPRLMKRVGEEGYMDPEQPFTGDYLSQICREIVSNYDVDGIHLDYIRYPEKWKMKVSRQKGREHITSIVRKIHDAVKGEKPWVKMSCSPIGKHDDLCRYRSGGWNARTAMCQDAQEWLRLGLMDQLYPMLYFKGDNFYPFAIDWQENAYGRALAGGLAIYFLDPREGQWTLDVVEREMNVLRQIGMGFCHFRAKFLCDNVKGIYDLTSRFCATPALIPPMVQSRAIAPQQPADLKLQGHTLSWRASAGSGGNYTLYNIYASEDYPVDISRAENLVATRLSKTSVNVPAGRMNFAVTAMNRYGQESIPAQLLLNAGPAYSAPTITITHGHPVRIPQIPTIDAEFIIIETMLGSAVAIRPYGSVVSIEDIPAGVYQLRTLGRKGRNHRIGFFSIVE